MISTISCRFAVNVMRRKCTAQMKNFGAVNCKNIWMDAEIMLDLLIKCDIIIVGRERGNPEERTRKSSKNQKGKENEVYKH